MLIQTDRLILREFEPEDWRPMMRYQSDPEFLRFYHWTERLPSDVQRFLRMFIDWQQERPRTRFQLAIVLREEGRMIGNCGIRMKEPAALEAELGYELDRACWGRGYASEAAGAIVDWAFRELHLHRVWASCIAENTASARVMERLGMTYEGRLRENDWIKGRWYDSLIYGILEHEWEIG